MPRRRPRAGFCGGDSAPAPAGRRYWEIREGVPQTPEDAHEAGWRWLRVTCPACGRSSSLELEAVPHKLWRKSLAKLARTMVCKRCGQRGADLAFAEKKREPGDRSYHIERPLAFRGDLVVRWRWE